MLRRFKFFGVLVLALLASACSTYQTKTDEQVVEGKALERLKYLDALDFEKAYQFMTPGYREVKDLEAFRFDFGGSKDILSYKLHSLSCADDQCIVLMDVEYDRSKQLKGLKVVRTNKETWIRVDGKWWFAKSE